jgi:hypothetical protein
MTGRPPRPKPRGPGDHDTLHDTIRDIRSFIVGLRPELLAAGDLAAGIRALADEVRSDALLAVEVAVSPATPERAEARRAAPDRPRGVEQRRPPRPRVGGLRQPGAGG